MYQYEYEVMTFFQEELFIKMDKVISKEVFTNKMADASSKNVTQWTHDGILVNDGVIDKTIQKFSMAGIIWLNLIVELRRLGFSKKNILRSKACLLNKIEEVDIDAPFLKYYLLRYLFFKQDCILSFTTDGAAVYFELEEYVEYISDEDILDKGHIVIPLRSLFWKLKSKIDESKYSFEQLFGYSEKEIEIIASIIKANYSTISILLNNGKEHACSYSDSEDRVNETIRILLKREYQYAEITYENNEKWNFQLVNR